jgi:hypothetical protein
MHPLFGTLRLLLGALLLHSCFIYPACKLGKLGAEKIANQLAQKPPNT